MLHDAGFFLNSGFSDNSAVVCISEIRPKQMPILVPIQRNPPKTTPFLETKKSIICPKLENCFGFYGEKLRSFLQLDEAPAVCLIRLAFGVINRDLGLEVGVAEF